jgi:hypothetical protein
MNEYLHANDCIKSIPKLDQRPINITKLKSHFEWVSHEKIADLVVQLEMTGQSNLPETEVRIRPLK